MQNNVSELVNANEHLLKLVKQHGNMVKNLVPHLMYGIQCSINVEKLSTNTHIAHQLFLNGICNMVLPHIVSHPTFR